MGFSQFGEEPFILQTLFETPADRRFYIDAGAFDPILFSNTLALRKLGWKGIHIEMDPVRYERLKRALPDHHHANVALSARPGVVCSRIKYALGETDKLIPKPPSELTEEEKRSGLGRDALEVFEEEASTLDSVLRQSPTRPESIAFLNIDCEGHDLEVLKGLDLNLCRPDLIAIECHSSDEREQVEAYLEYRDYEFHAWFRPTAFFKRIS